MKRVSWVMVMVLALALTGCGATAPPASQPPGTSTTVPAKTVPEQLKFTAKTLDGKDFSGESLAGKRVVFWFWTPWCPRCQGEAEDIVAAAKETEGRVQFVGVAAQDQVPAMQRFVDEHGLGFFPHIADTDGAVWKRFGVVEQPSHAFIKADGTIEMVLRQLPTNDLLDNVRLLAF
jgi:peroxiredoxin